MDPLLSLSCGIALYLCLHRGRYESRKPEMADFIGFYGNSPPNKSKIRFVQEKLYAAAQGFCCFFKMYWYNWCKRDRGMVKDKIRMMAENVGENHSPLSLKTVWMKRICRHGHMMKTDIRQELRTGLFPLRKKAVLRNSLQFQFEMREKNGR